MRNTFCNVNRHYCIGKDIFACYGLTMENKAHTKLKAWMKSDGRKIGWYADKIHAHPSTVSQWLSGTRKPSPVYRAAIETLTDGAVSAQEWGK